MKVKNPIFIVGPHRSGTTLLLRLFDDHPDLFTIPFETHPFECLGYAVDYEGRKRKHTKIVIDDFKANIIDLVKSVCKNDKDIKLIKNLFNIDEQHLWDVFGFDTDIKNKKEWIEDYFKMIYVCLNNKSSPSSLRIVEKSVEHAEFVPELKQMFPDAKFIHIVRNPYAYLHSYRNWLQRGTKKYPQLKKPLLSLKNNMYYLEKNKRMFPNDYMVIKYEDLVLNTGVTMIQLQNFLGLQNHPVLFRPTLLGNKWFGNSIIHGDLDRVSLKPLDYWRKHANHLETYYVNTYFKYLLRIGRYEEMEQKKHKNRRLKGENLTTYILNRTLEYNCFTGMDILEYLRKDM